MPKLKNYGAGRRVSIHIKERNFKMYDMIENKSRFFQIALDTAIDLMAWALLKEYDPEKYHLEHGGKPDDKIVEEFNEAYPLNEKTKLRKTRLNEKWQTPSQKTPDVLL